MTITIDLEPELEAELKRRSAMDGVDLGAYALLLLERAALPARRQRPYDPKPFEETLRAMARFSDIIPSLPDEAFSRESIYSDHD